jgi:hypothetical protein
MVAIHVIYSPDTTKQSQAGLIINGGNRFSSPFSLVMSLHTFIDNRPTHEVAIAVAVACCNFQRLTRQASHGHVHTAASAQFMH